MSSTLHTLASGRSCTLSQVSTMWLRNYFVFSCIAAEDPSSKDSEELLGAALAQARQLALERVADSGRYTLIFSGPKTRRRAGAHVHILLSDSRVQKAWLYFVLAGKNLLQAIGLRRDRQYEDVAAVKPNKSLERTRAR